jgi:hypothetical protein
MNSDNPYVPVQTPIRQHARKSDRPFFIYATAVVLLLWAGIYVYIQSQNEVTIDSEGVSIDALYYSRSLYTYDVLTIIALFSVSLALVNSALWATLKLLRR